MNSKLGLFFAGFLLSGMAYSQDFADKDKLVYLDSLNNETTTLHQVYFRVIKNFYSDADTYQVYDYYRSKKLKNEATVSDKRTMKRIGKYTSYYENGNKSSECYYNDESIPFGKFSAWYKDGQQRLEGEYVAYDDKNKSPMEQPVKIIQYWNANKVQKVINGNGYYRDEEYGTICMGKIADGLRDSIWTGKNRPYQFTFNEKYQNGKLISGVSIDSSKMEHKYTEMMIRPQPKNGLTGFYKYVASNFRTPDVEGLNGKIYSTFTVNTDGTVGDIRILKDIGYGSGEETIRILKKYKGFIPGQLRGINVKVQYSLPITIKPNN